MNRGGYVYSAPHYYPHRCCGVAIGTSTANASENGSVSGMVRRIVRKADEVTVAEGVYGIMPTVLPIMSQLVSMSGLGLMLRRGWRALGDV